MESDVANGFALPDTWTGIFSKIGIDDYFPTQLVEAFVWIMCYILLIVLKNKVKDSTRICIAILTYVLIRMFILEQIYFGYHAFADLKMTILYLTIIIVCTYIIVKNRKVKLENSSTC